MRLYFLYEPDTGQLVMVSKREFMEPGPLMQLSAVFMDTQDMRRALLDFYVDTHIGVLLPKNIEPN
jgi:hypothetical protein